MRRRPTLALVLILLVWGVAAAAAPKPNPPEPGPVSELAAAPTAVSPALRLTRASFEVDVLGPLAVGELIREFVSETETALLPAAFGSAPNLPLESMEVTIGGQTHQLGATAISPRAGRQKAKARPKAGRAAAPPPPAPIAPLHVEGGQAVIVRSTFRMALPLRDGRLQLRLPAVAPSHAGTPGAAAEPALEPGPPGAIVITVHHDEPLLLAESATHDVIASYEGDRTVIELAERETESRDFELEFALGVEDDPTLVGQVIPSEDGTHDVIVVLTPPMEPGEGAVRLKQVLFVLDSSGSMAKGKLEQARATMISCLEKMRPEDQFNIVRFRNDFQMMAEEPVSGESADLARATAWLNSLRPGGGTQLLPALLATFEQPESTDHHRMIILLTDGALQDRREVLEPLEQGLGEARLFVIGIGEDVTRETIMRLAELGRGTAVFADDPEGLNEVASAMFDSVADPLAWDLELDWGGAQVESMEPSRLPDLYAGRPVTVHARVSGELPEQVILEATTTGGLRQFTTLLTSIDGGRLSKLGKD